MQVPEAFHLGVGGGGHSTKFYTGRFHPEVQTLTLLCTITDRKGTPFVRSPSSYSFRRKLHPFHFSTGRLLPEFSLENPLKYLDESAAKCVYSRYFEGPLISTRQFFQPLSILQLLKSLPFIYLQPEKGSPFGRSLSI